MESEDVTAEERSAVADADVEAEVQRTRSSSLASHTSAREALAQISSSEITAEEREHIVEQLKEAEEADKELERAHAVARIEQQRSEQSKISVLLSAQRSRRGHENSPGIEAHRVAACSTFSPKSSHIWKRVVECLEDVLQFTAAMKASS